MQENQAMKIVELTELLAQQPEDIDKAIELVELVRSDPNKSSPIPINPKGLLAAMDMDGLDKQVLSELAFAFLEQKTAWGLFGGRLMSANLTDRSRLARQWLLPCLDPVLEDLLLRQAMETGFNVSRRSEVAFCAIREAIARHYAETAPVSENPGTWKNR